jgi:amino acid adenylation domain-containing protein
MAATGNVADIYPLSPSQQGLLTVVLLAPEGARLYCDQVVLELSGRLDAAAWREAWRQVVARHPALRTQFAWERRAQPLQVVRGAVELPWQELDWRGLAPDERERRLAALLRDDHARGFALDQAPLLRGAWVHWAPGSARFLWSFHHLVLDGWSMALVLAEVRACYEALLAGRAAELPPAPPFRDFIAWWKRWQGDGAEEFWRRELAGLPEESPLPFDRRAENGAAPPPDAPDGAVGVEEIELPLATSRGLAAAARRHRLTMNTFFQGAWALLLARTTARHEVVFGSVVSGRPPDLPGVEGIVGLFVNALPTRAAVEPGQELIPWLAALQERQVEQRRFEHLPLERILGWAGVPRERAALSSLVTFQNFPAEPLPGIGAGAGPAGPGLALRFAFTREVTHHPLALYGRTHGDGISLALAFQRQRFAPAAARRLLAMLARLLEGAAARPESRLGEIPLLSREERQELLAAAQGGPVPGGPVPGAAGMAAAAETAGVLAAIERQAARAPQAAAVEHGAVHLSYGELDARAERLAARLRRHGVAPEEVVAVCLERSPELVVALLAVWKAGAAWLPLDPGHPGERLALLLADSAARLVLTTKALASRLPPGPAGPTAVLLDRPEAAAPAHPPSAGRDADGAAPCPPGVRAPAAAAYVIYTSGSTGAPKGVVVDHAALASFVAAAGERLAIAPGDRVLQFAAVSFDASVEEVYPCLARGATLVLRDAGMLGSFGRFLDDVERLQLTVLDLPTAYWHELAAALAREGLALPAGVRLVILGGEEARPAALASWRSRVGPGVRLLNTYGPTEATVVATQSDLTLPAAAEGEGWVPIGRATADATAWVLGLGLEPLPAGLDGELWLGGPGLARGYLGRPDLTADRFRPDPFSRGQRLYRTGDRARQVAGGELAFRGRADGQVKVRGFRVELGELEAALRRLPGVAEAAAVLAGGDHGSANVGGDRRLVAFVVPATGAEAPAPPLAAAAVRAALARGLPEHMVPSAVTILPALPLSVHGKLDRAALAALPLAAPDPADGGGQDRDGDGSRRPRTPLEELLAGLWCELLGLERVELDDDFFTLGGHSLLVAQLLSRIRHALAVEVPVVELFRRPTLSALAALVEQAQRGALADELPELPPLRPRRASAAGEGPAELLPLSYAQERVWLLDQLTPGGNLAYNFQLTIDFRGPFAVPALARALCEIVRRHEVLRTSFPAVDGRPVQVVHAATPLRLPVIDLGGLPAGERAGGAERLVQELLATPFTLARGPLIRWRLLRLGPEEHKLVQVEHHFVHDGWSLAVLLGEIKTLYEAFRRGEPSPLAELPVQYADFALWQRQWMEGPVMARLLAFWQAKLAGAPPALELATDRPRPPQGSWRGEVELPEVEPALYEALRRFGRREGFTLYMTMLAGFLALLHRYTGQEDLVIGTSNANRRARELEGMLGMVVNTLVLRADLGGRPTWRALLGKVRELALELYAYQDMPFERLVQELRVERRPGRNPLFQVLFNFHDAPVPDFRVPGLDVIPEVRSNHTAKMDMNLIVVPRLEQRAGQQVRPGERRALLHWEYNTDLFDTATVLRMAGHYQQLLAAALAEPGRGVGELPLLTAAERAEVLGDWNDSATGYPRDASVPALFGARAAAAPDRTAVVRGGEHLSYGELEARANRLAHRLRGLGAGHGAMVALAVERSLDLVPAILAILKTGAAYLPLDPAWPATRLAWMLADSGSRLLVAQEHLLPRLPAAAEAGLATVVLPRDWARCPPAAAPSPPPGAGDLAYVMYTSGSTGRPKGVAVTHRNVVRLVMESAYVRFGPGEVLLQVAPISFDASTFELWGALLHGARLAVFPPESPSLERLGEVIARQQVTTAFLTTALFHQMVEGNLAGLAPLSRLLFGGELASPAHVGRLLAACPGLDLVHCYGPTEGTTFTTTCRLAAGAPPLPIGRPIANTSVLVCDPGLGLLPAGVPGELLVGGDGLAVGYLGRPDVTAERFVPDPFAGAPGHEPGGRLYRTGDRVRWLADGTLDFLGRFDHQVKIRGFRVEPGEIEAALATHPAVAEAAVVAQPEPGGAVGLRLAAYVVPRGGVPAAEAEDLAGELRRHLAASLPSYMVPAGWALLAALPQTATGKIDRRALASATPAAAPGAAARGAGRRAPRTVSEAAVAATWCQVLGLAEVGIDDDFFALGGHSLAATRVLSRLRGELGIELALGELFEHTVLADLAAAVDAAAPAAEPAEPIVAVLDLGAGAAAAAELAQLSDRELDALIGKMAGDPRP